MGELVVEWVVREFMGWVVVGGWLEGLLGGWVEYSEHNGDLRFG